MQHPLAGPLGQDVSHPPASQVSDAWHVAMFTADGAVSYIGGQAARHVDG